MWKTCYIKRLIGVLLKKFSTRQIPSFQPGIYWRKYRMNILLILWLSRWHLSGNNCIFFYIFWRIFWNALIYSLFHSAGFVSHTVKYISHTVVFVSHSVKQRILPCVSKKRRWERGLYVDNDDFCQKAGTEWDIETSRKLR